MKYRKGKEQGIVIQEGEEWVLVKYLYSDYIVDGFMLLNKKYIEFTERNEDEIFFEKVLKANNKLDVPNLDVPLTTNTLLKWLEDNQTTFQIDPKDESVCYIGRIIDILDKSIRFKAISAKGEWLGGYNLFRINSLMMISFDTDYINSIITYANSLNINKSPNISV